MSPYEFGQFVKISLSADTLHALKRIGMTALASTAGGVALGAYPGLQLQRMSEAAGHPELLSFVAGKAPMVFAGALSGGLYNEWADAQEQNQDKKLRPELPGKLKYLKYLTG